MYTKAFWQGLLERGLKTAAQFVLFAWGLVEIVQTGPVGAQVPNAFEFDWKLGLGAALAGFLMSAISSFASLPFGPKNSPSVVIDTSNEVKPDAV